MKGENRALVVLNHTIDHHLCSLLSILFLWTVLLARSLSLCSYSIALTHGFTYLFVGLYGSEGGRSFPSLQYLYPFLFCSSLAEDGAVPTVGAVLWSGRMRSVERKKKGGHFFPSWGAQQHFEAWASVRQWMGLGILKLSRVHSPFTVHGIMDDCTLCSEQFISLTFHLLSHFWMEITASPTG